MGIWQKTAITVAGGALIVAGMIMLVTPGPGLVAIGAGLALLAREYAWAERFLVRFRAWLKRRVAGGKKKG